jgi:hypothetical protein
VGPDTEGALIDPADLIGVWRLIGGTIAAADDSVTGQPYGPDARGLLTLGADGRMLAVLVDARAADADMEREFASYCGEYHFDGEMLTTTPYAYSDRRFSTPQRRHVSMKDGKLILRPPPTVRMDGSHVQRELVWERISTASA